MTTLAFSNLSVSAPVNQTWITPEKQLQLLASTSPLVEKISKGGDDEKWNGLPADIANIVSEYAIDGNYTYWHTALKRINALPEKIPALPRNIHQILNGKCPIYSDQLKPDGTSYKVRNTHVLYLIPPGTLNELEARVSAYGQMLNANENPLQFRYFWPQARQEHADIQFNEPQWILITTGVVPGSCNQPYKRQAQIVAGLSARACVNYEIPSLRHAVGASLLHGVTTGGACLYQAGDKENNHIHTYTRVENTTQNYHLVVGGAAPSGVDVSHAPLRIWRPLGSLGVAAVRKF